MQTKKQRASIREYNEQSIKRKLDRDGKLESDIEACNARIRRQKEETRRYSENRLRADSYHLEQEIKAWDKEVWE